MITSVSFGSILFNSHQSKHVQKQEEYFLELSIIPDINLYSKFIIEQKTN